jgi:hypothetical protein
MMLLVDQEIIMQDLDRAITQLNYTLIILPMLPPDSDVAPSIRAARETLKRAQKRMEEIYAEQRVALDV